MFFVALVPVPKLWLLRAQQPLLVRFRSGDDLSASTTPSSSGSRALKGGLELRLVDLEELEDLEDEVGVVWDHSKCLGNERRLCWEVAVVFPEQVKEELQAMEKGSAASLVGIGGSAGIKSPLGKELLVSWTASHR